MTGARAEVLGVPVDPLDWREARRRVVAALAGEARLRILAVNPEKVMRARQDAELLDSLGQAEMLVPDGIGVVWVLRRLGHAGVERVPGVEVAGLIAQACAESGCGLALVGGRPGVAERAGQVLQALHPGLEAPLAVDGYEGIRDEDRLLRLMQEHGAGAVLVALGSPAQEKWINRLWDRLPVQVAQGVGGTLDVLAGEAVRAPAAWRRVHLEWLYRLLRQPSRASRQARALVPYALMCSRYLVGGRSSSDSLR